MDNSEYTYSYMTDTFRNMYGATKAQCLSPTGCYNQQHDMASVSEQIDIYNSIVEEQNQEEELIPELNFQSHNINKVQPLLCETGDLSLCCDASLKNLGTTVQVADYEKINPLYDEDNNLSQVELCNCGKYLDESQIQQCVENSCNNFRDPTVYESCKIEDGMINTNDNVMDTILIDSSAYDSETVVFSKMDMRPDCSTTSCARMDTDQSTSNVSSYKSTIENTNSYQDRNLTNNQIAEEKNTIKTVLLVALITLGIFLLTAVGVVVILRK